MSKAIEPKGLRASDRHYYRLGYCAARDGIKESDCPLFDRIGDRCAWFAGFNDFSQLRQQTQQLAKPVT